MTSTKQLKSIARGLIAAVAISAAFGASAATVAASSPQKPTAATKCAPGEELLIISAIKKQKDGTITFSYKGTKGTGNIPPNAGAFYTDAQKKKVGDGICSEKSE